VQRVLRQHAYRPRVFSTAQEFQNYVDIEKAVCVILDINLPDGSGIELRDGLNEAGISVPVIYVTAGCIAFLTKRFSTQALIEPLKKATAARS